MGTHVFRYLVDGELAVGQVRLLSNEDSHHLVRVVRRTPGDELRLLDADGTIWPAVVVDAEMPASVRVTGPGAPAAERAPVHVYLGLLDWSRLDTAHAQLTELGVPDVTIFSSERSGRIPKAEEWARRASRLDRVAESAARQSAAAGLPNVRGVVPFDEVIQEIPTGHGYLLHPLSRTALATALADGSGVPACIVIGPEAGFSDDELDAADAVGISVCGLGERVLRTGTAVVVAVSVALAAVGALGAGAGE